MKCMQIFLALLLSKCFIQESFSLKQSLDPKFSAASIAGQIIKDKQTEDISSKSDIDNNPDNYLIMSADQLKESAGTKGDEYYPGPNSTYESPANSQTNLRRSSNYYKKDPKPYYGFSKTDYRIVSETNTGIEVPVQYKELDDIQGTQDHLDSLKEKLNKLHDVETTPNREYVGNAAVYDKDAKPYYNPLKNVQKEKEDYLKGVISQVEDMLNDDIETKDIKYSRVKVGEVIYQNTQNKEAEQFNESLSKLSPTDVVNARKLVSARSPKKSKILENTTNESNPTISKQTVNSNTTSTPPPNQEVDLQTLTTEKPAVIPTKKINSNSQENKAALKK